MMIVWFIFVFGKLLLTTSIAIGDVDVLGKKTLERSHIRFRRERGNGKMFPFKVSFVYKNSNEKNWKLNKNTIKDAVEIMSDVFKSLNVRIVLQNVREIKHDRLFLGKSTDVLKVFLKHKQQLINPRYNNNVQLITTKAVGSDHELAGAATFQTVCSRASSGGILIVKYWEISHLALLMAHNLACNMGISNKKFCSNGFTETDIKCYIKRKPLTTNEITKCILDEIDVDLKHYDLNALCEKNRAQKAKQIQLTVDYDDEKPRKLILILAGTGGGLLLIMVIVATYKLKKNYNQEKLLKDRVSVEYNYEAGTPRCTRHSLINDPTVTNDLK